MLQTAVKGLFGSFLFLKKGILILLTVYIMQVVLTVWHSVNYPLNEKNKKQLFDSKSKGGDI